MWTLLAVALSACAYYVSIGLGEFWPAAWIAPIPVLLVAFRSSWRTAALAAFAAYFLGSLNLFAFLAKIAPVLLLVAELAVIALIFAAAVLVARFAVRRLPGWASAFAFPAAWTSYKFLSSLVSPHSTSLSLAYAQTDVLPLIQIASVTGLWGVTFVVTLPPPANREVDRARAQARGVAVAELMRGVDFSGVRPPEIMSTLRRRWPTGRRTWSAATGNLIESSPAVANGVVYVGSFDRKLYAFSAQTGQTISAATGNYIQSSPAVANGVVLRGVGRRQGLRVQCRHRTTGLDRVHRERSRVVACGGQWGSLRGVVRWEAVRFQRHNRTNDLERGHRRIHPLFAGSGQRGGLRGVVRQRYLLLTSSGERVRLRGFGNGRWQPVLLRPAAGERSGAGRTTTCPAGTGHAQT